MSGIPPAASPDELRRATVEAILAASRRSTLPLRVTFIQQREVDGTAAAGPLSVFVRRGRRGAFDQHLLLRAWASGGDHDVRRSAAVWARAVGLPDGSAGRRAVARNWQFMQQMRLVTIARAGRLLQVTALAEDGSGRPYHHPGSQPRSDYLQLPYAYWEQGWDQRLSLPGKAVLLIALSLGDLFWLPARHGPAWYGLSPSTIERGVRDLRIHQLLGARAVRKPAPLAAAGYTAEHRYTLHAPFGPKGVLARGAPAQAQGSGLLADPTP